MNDPTQPAELHRLFIAKTDGTISAEEHERLTALLKNSADARREWFAFQDAEAGLLAWSQREALQGSELPVESAPSKTIQRSSLKLMLLGSLAAGIVIGAVTWAVWPQGAERLSPSSWNVATRDEATTSAVALLTRGVDLVWESSAMTPAVNEPLSPGELKLRSGVAEIEFFQGARLCIEGPASIRLVSAGEAFCSSGRFSAEVPPHARGFRIGTPKGDLVDLGTEFGLDLTSAAPKLHVFKGEVEWHQPQAPMRLLTTGQASGLQATDPAEKLVADPSAFAFSRDISSASGA